MKAWELDGFGMRNLRFVDKDVPIPQGGEILVRVSAVALNLRDKLLMDGVYNPQLAFPMIQGSDAVGTVVEVGTNVTRVQQGDRIITNFSTTWLDGPPTKNESADTLGSTISGALAEYIVIGEEVAVHVPAYLSDVEASTLPTAAVTAWYALTEKLKVSPGQTLLLHGTGGVSLFALQIAVALKVRTIISSSSEDKLDRVRAMGATHGLNYEKHSNWPELVHELTNGRGADAILEVIGGKNIARSVEAVKAGGAICAVGFIGGPSAEIGLFPFITKQVSLSGSTVGPRSALEDMLSFFEKWQIHPLIDKVYPFAEVKDAYKRLKSAAAGKVIIDVASG